MMVQHRAWQRFRSTRGVADFCVLTLLLLLWFVFFWRLLFPFTGRPLSFVSGDFSAQNYAFSVYQFERLRAGEIALWNPYSYGGSPFLADVQASVFYPPRLLSMGFTALLGGDWRYESLQTETLLHVLLTSCLAYAFFRRLTLGRRGSQLGALGGALVWGYGGFLSGYPQLQANIMAAACWLPLMLLGAHEATRARGRLSAPWLAVSSAALALSALAGHPQTTTLSGYLWLAFFTHRCWQAKVAWWRSLAALLAIGALTFALSAVLLLPAAEYLQASARGDLTYADKANGFPLRDWLQFLLPNTVSHWSPLYFSVVGFALAIWALLRRLPHSNFWAGSALLSLLLSLGGNGFLYPALYSIMPGLALFRQQERAAVLVAFSAAALVTLALTTLRGDQIRHQRSSWLWVAIMSALLLLTAALSGAWGGALVSAIFLLATLIGTRFAVRQPTIVRTLFLLILVELLIFNTNNPNFSPQRGVEQLPGMADALRHSALVLGYSPPARVDGVIGLGGNFGAMYALADIRGISPLFLRGPQAIIYQDDNINPLAWELFAVSHVFHDWRQLPTPVLGSDVIVAREGTIYVHRLANPRPFAQFLPRYSLVNSQEMALAALGEQEPAALRELAILETAPPNLPKTNAAALYASAELRGFAPERIEFALSVPAPSLLSIALPYDGNWRARVDGDEIPLQRAYGALSALVIPADVRTLVLVYQPRSYIVGALLSTIAWLSVLGGLLFWIFRKQGAGQETS